jgi:hypothetical protein
MGNFDGTVAKIVGEIKAAQAKKESEAKSATETAETTFGGVGKLIEELRPQLSGQFPDLAPQIWLGPWVKRGDGQIENNLTLQRNETKKEVPLVCQGDRVRVGKDTMPSEGASAPAMRAPKAATLSSNCSIHSQPQQQETAVQFQQAAENHPPLPGRTMHRTGEPP